MGSRKDINGNIIRCPECNSSRLSFFYAENYTEIYCQKSGCWAKYITTSVNSKDYGLKFKKLEASLLKEEKRFTLEHYLKENKKEG